MASRRDVRQRESSERVQVIRGKSLRRTPDRFQNWFVVGRETFRRQLFKNAGRPNAKARRSVRVDSITDGDERVEVVELRRNLLRFPFDDAVLRGYFQNGNNRFFVEFSFGKNIFAMPTD